MEMEVRRKLEEEEQRKKDEEERIKREKEEADRKLQVNKIVNYGWVKKRGRFGSGSLRDPTQLSLSFFHSSATIALRFTNWTPGRGQKALSHSQSVSGKHVKLDGQTSWGEDIQTCAQKDRRINRQGNEPDEGQTQGRRRGGWVHRHTGRLTYVHLTLTSFKLLITPSLGVSPTTSRSVSAEG